MRNPIQKIAIEAVAQGGVRAALRPFRGVLAKAVQAKQFVICASR
jgi:hypothetical protein